MNRFALAFAAVLSFEAAACGVCIDDKIASSYDHAVIAAAHARGHAVAFFAIEGDIVRSDETRRAVLRAIQAAPGVQRGSARVSLENGALSFAYDPARNSAADAGRAVAAALERQRLHLNLLRTLSPADRRAAGG
jgi:N-acetyl-beta-hexosaminidase